MPNNNFPDHGTSFSDKEVRKRFVRKVYGLLCIELLILTGFTLLGATLTPLKVWVHNHIWEWFGIVIGLSVACLIPYIALVCYQSVRKSVPTNYIVLNIHVILESLMVMFVAAHYELWVVLAALGTTTALVLFLTLISFIPGFDVTGWVIWFVAITFVASMYSTIAFLLYMFIGLKILIVILAGIGVVISSLWIIFMTQMIIGGKKYELDPDEYILGCIFLFINIVSMLMDIMYLFGN